MSESQHAALLGGEEEAARDESIKPWYTRPPFLVALGLFVFAVVIGFAVAGYILWHKPSDDAAAGPIVRVNEGELQGFQVAEEEGVLLFNNIPFAAPPVGELRWRAPQPPLPWQGVRDAVGLSNPCAQPSLSGQLVGSEDCLVLNVYTKSLDGAGNVKNSSAPSPVLVFIHGGSNMMGWSSHPLNDHSHLVADRDVVAVTVNYRLNVFGYLALDVLNEDNFNKTGNATSGNYGILDHIAALKWIKANIASFGGDPKRVTVYGQSSGGTNLMALWISPLARGLFDAGLSLSASPVMKGNMSFALQQNAPLIASSGCSKSTSKETRDCIYS